MTSSRRRTIIVVASVALISGLAVFLAGWASDDTWVARSDHLPSATGNVITLPDGGEYAFIATQGPDDEPITYDPCEPIRLVVNSRTAAPRAERLLAEAIARVEQASGLEFVIEGSTDESDSADREIEMDDGWAPVLVEWSDERDQPDLEGDVLGLAGSSSYELDGHRWFVSGSVLLDGPDLARASDNMVRAVIMHELAHLVGLDHVDSEDELMHPFIVGLDDWGPGDLVGLAEIGSGRCANG